MLSLRRCVCNFLSWFTLSLRHWSRAHYVIFLMSSPCAYVGRDGLRGASCWRQCQCQALHHAVHKRHDRHRMADNPFRKATLVMLLAVGVIAGATYSSLLLANAWVAGQPLAVVTEPTEGAGVRVAAGLPGLVFPWLLYNRSIPPLANYYFMCSSLYCGLPVTSRWRQHQRVREPPRQYVGQRRRSPCGREWQRDRVVSISQRATIELVVDVARRI